MNTYTQAQLTKLFSNELHTLLNDGYQYVESVNLSTTDACIFVKKGNQTLRLSIYNVRNSVERLRHENVRQILIQETDYAFADENVNVIKSSPIFYEIAYNNGCVYTTDKNKLKEINELKTTRAIQKSTKLNKVTPTNEFVAKLNTHKGFKTARTNKVTITRCKNSYKVQYSKQVKVYEF